MTRVIHTGDTHLGYRQYHSPERRDDFLAAFRRVVDDAIAEEVDAVVHAGDLFHDRSPALADVHGAILVLRDLREAEIPFLAVVGNHERTHGGQWIDLFSTLGLATRLGDEPTKIGDVALYGLDFVPRSKRDDLAYDFAPHDAEFAALVAHGLFTPFNTEWNTEEVLSASSVEFDAMLLGDDHQPDTARVEGTWVTYCGSTERTSAAERDERGYNIVEFDDGDTRSKTGDGVSIRRRGIETRPFVNLELELSDGEGTERVRERLREEVLEDAVVVVRVDGEGDDLQPARIEEFASDRGALVARVTDRREIAAAELDAVHFADPDTAVRERVRELGLSEAALAIDETVRSDVADSNVRGRVRERIEALMDEDGAFEPRERDADTGAFEETEEGVASESESEVVDAGESQAADDPTLGDEGTTETTGAAVDAGDTGNHEDEAVDGEGGDEAGVAASAADAEDGETTDDEGDEADTASEADPSTDGESTDVESSRARGSGGDGQVTMEDYL